MIEFKSITKTYRTRTGPVQALQEINLTVGDGEFVSLLGPSGCGKSTLLRIAAGLIPCSSGEVVVDGRPVDRPQTQVGMVFQQPNLLKWRTTEQNILLQAQAKRIALPSARATTAELLETVGLSKFRTKYPYELSGGMQQRVSICRALLHDPSILLMDEPFGALDAITRDEMSLMLEGLWERKQRTMLFVTHSIPEAVALSDRVVVMSKGPARVLDDVVIDIPRPRDTETRETQEYTGYVARLRRLLGQ